MNTSVNPHFPASSTVPPHLRAALGRARLRASWLDDGPLCAMGVGEPMPAGLVRRPGGTGDILLMLFHQPVRVRLSTGLIVVPANSLVVWQPGMAQEYGRSEAAWLHSWLHLRGAQAAAMARAAGLVPGVPIACPDPQLVESLLLELHAERQRQPSDPVIIESLITILLRRVARLAPPATDAVAEVRARVLGNPEARHRLGDLAAVVDCSPQHLCRLFRARHGVSPVAFALEVRLRHAARLLRAGGIVAEVSRRCGWADRRQFCRVFSAQFGASPSAYRGAPRR